MKSIPVVSNEGCEDRVCDSKTTFFLDLLEANLSPSAIKNKWRLKLETEMALYNTQKPSFFSFVPYLLEQNLLLFA